MSIIPKPKKYSENGTLEISAQFSADKELLFCRKAFLRIVKKTYGVYLYDGKDGIILKYDASIPKDGYVIEGAVVKASDKEGASYGLATMLQLMEKTEDGFILKNTEIEEKPDKEFRAFMSDFGRKFHDFEVLISYVDLCYVNKIKYLQLHFTDNLVWSLYLDCFPNAVSEDKYYTKSEIAYLVEYAREACVELIPEFEGIGHSQTLNNAYPDVFGNEFDIDSDDKDTSINYEKNYNDNIMCIGRPGIFENIRKMMTEIAEMFPYSQYMHVGCDEAKHEDWLRCKHCRKYMQDNGLKTTKETYSHFTKKIIDICFDLGKTPIVWEGFPREGNKDINKDTIVVSWENYYQTTQELLEDGFKIINASWKPMYIVPMWKYPELKWSVTEKDWNLYNWQNWAKFSKAYEPFTIEPNENVIGGMLCQWECTVDEERDRVIENLPMAADRTWNEFGYYSADEFEKAKEKIIFIGKKLFQ